jgi:DsbC/DsbD-like thiol-disulfide interchange protein
MRRAIQVFHVLAAVALILVGAVSTQAQGRQEAAATPWVEIHASRVRLIGGQTEGDGARYLAGLEIVLSEGWKTYWRMPGDSGVPPTFDWSKSRNLASAQVLYPPPTRMQEAGGVAVGYKGAVIMPIRVTAKDPGAPVQLHLALEFGICRDICIPAMVNLALDFVPGAAGPPPQALLAALDTVPRPHHKRRARDPELKRARVVQGTSPLRIEFDGIFQGTTATTDMFVEAPNGLYVPLPVRQVSPGGGGGVRFDAELSADLAKDLQGKTLTLTLVDDAGATETRWTFP